MSGTKCVAMILAGGLGERLGSLTRYGSKPAVHFGDGRIIDYAIKNCVYSDIFAAGVLSQYFSDDLHAYIDTAFGVTSNHSPAEDRLLRGGLYMLPPRSRSEHYRGTADAVYKNIRFLDNLHPEHVMILAGDHIYKMDYRNMLAFHIEKDAAATIASTRVPAKQAYRYGILAADQEGAMYDFAEKPHWPRSNLASMGIYIFQWDVLREYLVNDSEDITSRHDFGHNIIPEMLNAEEPVYTYEFDGYWRDVGTVDSLWEANMDILDTPEAFRPREGTDNMSKRRGSDLPCVLSHGASTVQSILSPGCTVFGSLKHSVLGQSVIVGKNSQIIDSVIMPRAYIGENVKLYRTVVGAGAQIMDNTVIGTKSPSDFFIDRRVCSKSVSLVAPLLYIPGGMRLPGGSHIHKDRLNEWLACGSQTAGAFRSNYA